MNNYKDINIPNHHRARQGSGNVSEHILVAEDMLGRSLRKGEVVHHIDENKANNSPENLCVFKDDSNHIRYHRTSILEKVDDYWISPPAIGSKERPYSNLCKLCGDSYNTTFEESVYCSVTCYREGSRKTERPSRDELEYLTQNNTFVSIGNKYGVSCNTVRKWCKQYGLEYRKRKI